MTARAWWAGALLVVFVGCSTEYDDDGYICTKPDKTHLGADGMPDPCHDRDVDAGDDPQCDVGEYVHWKYGWESPSWLWIGAEGQAPECPHGPASIAYEGRADLVAPTACESCNCEPPKGSCALPSALTASDAACGTMGAIASFDAPALWNGLCDNTTHVPQGKANSLTVGKLIMTENGCESGPTVPAKVLSLHWDTFARACDMQWISGPLQRSICLPDEPLPPGFSLCIFQNGENDCPNDEPGNVFTERHVFYKGVEDDRQCSTCTCGAPVGSACTAALSVYKNADATCTGPTVVSGLTISSVKTTCVDIQLPGQALGSKAAGATTYLPGTCPAMGGDASGSAVKTKPATLCCRL